MVHFSKLQWKSDPWGSVLGASPFGRAPTYILPNFPKTKIKINVAPPLLWQMNYNQPAGNPGKQESIPVGCVLNACILLPCMHAPHIHTPHTCMPPHPRGQNEWHTPMNTVSPASWAVMKEIGLERKVWGDNASLAALRSADLFLQPMMLNIRF